jgi:hypothetical protein
MTVPKRIEIRGKRWNLEVVDRLPDSSHGEIDPNDRPGKQIRIARNQNPLDLLDTVVHECLHAACPDLCEEAVTESATDIAKVLHRLGCRVRV